MKQNKKSKAQVHKNLSKPLDKLELLSRLKSTNIAKLALTSHSKGLKPTAQVIVQSNVPTVKELNDQGLQLWPKEIIMPNGITFGFKGKEPTWIVHTREELSIKSDPSLELKNYGLFRDLAGDFLRSFEQTEHSAVINFAANLSEDDIVGFLVGLELASYRFKSAINAKTQTAISKLILNSELDLKPMIAKAVNIAGSINISRHLVNLSGADLTPKTFSDLALKFFAKSKRIKTKVLNAAELKKQNCNLILAVGMSAKDKPCLVHLRFTPAKKTKNKSVAVIGKGVTFDSGGLDIKPSSGMRMMKKDMGGAASMFGLASWLDSSQCEKPVDIFLSLAENAISENSMRPGDVFVSKSGLSVEIHNTDAEGRLVLADAMTLAKELGCEKIIDVATLTGAIKQSLGGDVSGLFANDVKLRDQLFESAQKVGEPTWPMPLVQSYRVKMKSTVADMQNSVDGFGGAVTAALFLQSFAGTTPWAHFDIYSWVDSAGGCWSEAGGNGQTVQTLIKYLES